MAKKAKLEDFTVIAYDGDFPLQNQPHWGIGYPVLGDAIKEAFVRWLWLLREQTCDAEQAAVRELCVLVVRGDEALYFILENPCEELRS